MKNRSRFKGKDAVLIQAAGTWQFASLVSTRFVADFN